VQDILHIDIDNLKSSFIKIIDSKGNTILSQQASPTISTNQLAGGVYYLLMFDSKNNIVAKKSFIKR
jgi:hypothetical protein